MLGSFLIVETEIRKARGSQMPPSGPAPEKVCLWQTWQDVLKPCPLPCLPSRESVSSLVAFLFARMQAGLAIPMFRQPRIPPTRFGNGFMPVRDSLRMVVTRRRVPRMQE